MISLKIFFSCLLLSLMACQSNETKSSEDNSTGLNTANNKSIDKNKEKSKPVQELKNIKKSVMVFYIPKSVDLKDIKQALDKVLKPRVKKLTIAENPLPKRLKRISLSPTQTKNTIDTSKASYSVTGIVSENNAHDAKYEAFSSSIYPFAKGYKVFIYLLYQEAGDSYFEKVVSKTKKKSGRQSFLYYMAEIRENLLDFIQGADIIKQSPRKLEKIIVTIQRNSKTT